MIIRTASYESILEKVVDKIISSPEKLWPLIIFFDDAPYCSRLQISDGLENDHFFPIFILHSTFTNSFVILVFIFHESKPVIILIVAIGFLYGVFNVSKPEFRLCAYVFMRSKTFICFYFILFSSLFNPTKTFLD